MEESMTKKIFFFSALCFILSGMIFAQPKRNFPAQAGNSFSVVGDWVFTDSNYFVKIEIDYDGDMEVKMMEQNRIETEWEGYWSASDSQIFFNAYKKETKDYTRTMWNESKVRVNERWVFDYKMTDQGLVLTCPNLPGTAAKESLYSRRW